MTGKIHKEILNEIIQICRNKGLRVIQIDSKRVPDAIICEGKAIAVEIQSNPQSITDKKKQYDGINEFDETLIIAPIRRRYHAKRYWSDAVYMRVLELLDKGKSQKDISRIIESEFARKMPQSTISMFLNGHRCKVLQEKRMKYAIK